MREAPALSSVPARAGARRAHSDILHANRVLTATCILILQVASAFAMAWTLQSRTLRAFAALAVGIASVGVTAYDNSRYDNVSHSEVFRLVLFSQLTHWLGRSLCKDNRL